MPSDTQSLIEELERQPKKPIESLELADGRQFFWCSMIALLFPVSAGLCYIMSVYAIRAEPWWTAACVLLVVTILVLIFWASYLTKLIRDRRELGRISAGYYLAAWQVPQEQWDARQQENRADVDTACWWIIRIVPAIGFLGAGFGALLDVVAGGESGMRIFPVIFPHGLNTAGYTAIGVISAVVIVGCLRFLTGIREQTEDSGVPQVVVSETGLYTTGVLYRKSALTELVEVKLLNVPSDSLSFVYQSVGDAVIRNAVVVPIPKDEISTAKALKRILNKQ